MSSFLKFLLFFTKLDLFAIYANNDLLITVCLKMHRNQINVENLILQIKSELSVQTGSWRKIATLLRQADAEYGFGSKEMSQILQQTDISISKANKLTTLAKDQRISDHPEIFDKVTAWTTLYQASRLDDVEFERLVERIKPNQVLTLSDVKSSQTKRKKIKSGSYTTMIKVGFDLDAVRSQQISFEQISEVIAKVEEFVGATSFMEIETTTSFENEVSKYNNEVQKQLSKEIKKIYLVKEKEYRKHYHLKKGARLGVYDRSEIKNLIADGSWEELFENLDQSAEYQSVVSKCFDSAMTIVQQRREIRYYKEDTDDNSLDDATFESLKRTKKRGKRI